MIPNKLGIVAIEILEQCNLYCSFCVRNASKLLKGILSVESLSDILDKFSVFDEKPQVALTGGEPLMHKNFLEIIQKINTRGFSFSITTNGTIYREDVLDVLLKSILFRHFIVSLDSANELIHNQIRCGENSYRKTLHFIEKIAQVGLPFCINMTVNEKNYESIADTIKLAKEMGAKDISVATVKPNGRGEALLTQREQKNIAQQLFECKGLADNKFKILANDITFFLHHLQEYEELIKSGVNRSCAFGNASLHIQTNGDILACTACSMILGNIFSLNEYEIRQLWESNEILRNVRSKGNLTGICGGCEYKKFCGGCRCRAYALNKDLYAEDPYCPIVNQSKPNLHV